MFLFTENYNATTSRLWFFLGGQKQAGRKNHDLSLEDTRAFSGAPKTFLDYLLVMALTGRQVLKTVSLAISMGPCSQGSEVCTWAAVVYTASCADLFLAQGMSPLQVYGQA